MSSYLHAIVFKSLWYESIRFQISPITQVAIGRFNVFQLAISPKFPFKWVQQRHCTWHQQNIFDKPDILDCNPSLLSIL